MKTGNFESVLEGVPARRQPPISGTTLRQTAIPVIALKALAMTADEERTQSTRGDAYLVKPFLYVGPCAVTERHLLEPEQADKKAVPPSRSPR